MSKHNTPSFNIILCAWDICVSAFRDTKPQDYITYDDWFEDPSNDRDTSDEENMAFSILRKSHLLMPGQVGNGE